MNNKWKWLGLIALLGVLVVLSFGCAQNPRGGYGPDWDVKFKVPAMKKDDLFKDSLDLKGFSKVGYDISNSSNIKLTLTGEKEDEIEQEVELPLPKIPLDSGLISFSADGGIADGSFDEVLLDSISFDEFTSLTLSEKEDGINKLEVALNNNSGTGENTIDELTVKLQDDSGSVISSVTFSNVDPGNSSTKQMNLAGAVLGDGNQLAVAGNQNSGMSTYTIDVNSSKLEIEKVEELTSTQFTTDIDPFTESFDIGHTATLDDGGLRFDLQFPEETNLAFSVNNFSIDGVALTDDNGDGYRDIGQELDLNSEFSLGGSFSTSGDTVTYDASKQVVMEAAIYGTLGVGVPEDVELEAENNYLIYKLAPTKFEIEDSTLDKIDENLKSANLVTVTGSELSVGLSAELYVGEGEDFEYNETTKVGTVLDIQPGDNKNIFQLDQEARDKFRGGNTYLGVKIKLGDGEQTKVDFAEEEAVINLEAFGELEAKVNSNNQ